MPCNGDACQPLPPEPVDPTLTTLLAGPGNPPVRYPSSKGKRCQKGLRQEEGKCVRKGVKAKQEREQAMRRSLAIALVAMAALSLGAGGAQAAVPTLGSVSATNIQGVSALLDGSGQPRRA